jgi:hypothetical protein
MGGTLSACKGPSWLERIRPQLRVTGPQCVSHLRVQMDLQLTHTL